ncbi:hypothetical protein BKA16_000948 [Gordonia humi]|uniref:Uncharacterized protein n=1 Tax=Gordonia humi TaxID=686429 RepID=A0A840EX60_9ACTN|nr:hypothetical protein [Gordonia humi]
MGNLDSSRMCGDSTRSRADRSMTYGTLPATPPIAGVAP